MSCQTVSLGKMAYLLNQPIQ